MSQRPIGQRPPLTVGIVLHWSELGYLTTTLSSLNAAVAQAGYRSVPVAIVDQSLSDQYNEVARGKVESLSVPYLTVQWHDSVDNRGYGAGHNTALRALGAAEDGALHLILNPDVELDQGAVCEGLTTLERHPDAALVAPVSHDADGRREYLAKAYPSLRVLLTRGFGPAWLARRWSAELARYELHHLDAVKQPAPITLASGACMLVPRRLLEEVGGFDERYFLYFEDYDLSMRLREHGPLLQAPSMQIRHFGGGAARKGGQHIRWFGRGAIRFFTRWGWRWW